jgi:factor associated with neutral sphingomyelinase activation
MEPQGKQAFAMATQLVVKMRANMMDAPYIFEKGSISNWLFTLSYAQLSAFMPTAHQYLAASRLPYSERDEALQVCFYDVPPLNVTEQNFKQGMCAPVQPHVCMAKDLMQLSVSMMHEEFALSWQALSQQRVQAAVFDTSRLVDFVERVLFDGAASQLTPLVSESGRLVITDQRLYFQPLHNVTSDSPVRVHALADVAAVARRRSSLKPIGAPLGFTSPRRASACISIPILTDLDCPGRGSSQQQCARVFCAGLELFFIDEGSSSGPSIFFAFGTELERDRAASLIAQQPNVGANLPGGREAAAACGSILEVRPLMHPARSWSWMLLPGSAWTTQVPCSST